LLVSSLFNNRIKKDFIEAKAVRKIALPRHFEKLSAFCISRKEKLLLFTVIFLFSVILHSETFIKKATATAM
jgi:hypothetical protein